MARTTIDIDSTVLAELKQRSRREGKSVGALASELLAQGLAVTAEPDPELSWATSDMGALVDLGNKDRIRDMLDEP